MQIDLSRDVNLNIHVNSSISMSRGSSFWSSVFERSLSMFHSRQGKERHAKTGSDRGEEREGTMTCSFSIQASRTCEHMASANRRTTPKPARFTPKEKTSPVEWRFDHVPGRCGFVCFWSHGKVILRSFR